MSDDNDNSLTKPKKERSDAQKAAYLKMVEAREAKLAAKPPPTPKEVKMTPQEKKLRLQAIKEQLAGKKAEPEDEDESEDDEVVEEPIVPPKKVKKEKQREKVDEPIMRLPKKQPKIIYQDTDSEDQSEEEVIVVKRRKKNKKPKKKTIIYEDSSSESEEEPVTRRSVPLEPVRKERETKTQQNAGSKFKVTPATVEKPKIVSPYYFAD